MTLVVSLALLIGLSAACAPPEGEEISPPAEVPVSGVVEGHAPDEPAIYDVDGLTITELRDSPSFPDASLSLASPAAETEIQAGEPVAFDFEVSGFELGAQTEGADEMGLANSAEGQHIHLIVDNGPYSAHYEADFERDIEQGYHVVLAFLSRSWHESLKSAEASLVRELFVGVSPEEVERAKLDAPHLFYSRPKGTYSGADAERLMLDFYLVNAELGPQDYKVRATIDGKSVTFTRWVPYVIEGLPMGEVTIKLELLDADDQLVDSPFNPVERTVTLEGAAETM